MFPEFQENIHASMPNQIPAWACVRACPAQKSEFQDTCVVFKCHNVEVHAQRESVSSRPGKSPNVLWSRHGFCLPNKSGNFVGYLFFVVGNAVFMHLCRNPQKPLSDLFCVHVPSSFARTMEEGVVPQPRCSSCVCSESVASVTEWIGVRLLPPFPLTPLPCCCW